MSNAHRETALEAFYEDAEVMYYLTCFDSDGEELSFIHGVDYEDLAEQARKIPDYRGQVVYELSATVNSEEVHGKVTGFTADSCLEGFRKVENAVSENIVEQFESVIEPDYDAIRKDM